MLPGEPDYTFLPYLMDEEIYLVRPPKKTETATFRGTVFFVDYPGIPTVPTKEKILLNKIMEAVRLQQVQITIVNIPELMTRLSSRARIRFDHARAILFTGKVPPLLKFLGIENKYEIREIENSEFILSDALEVLDQDIEMKKNLWYILKKMFSV
jgi:hypothetical protein